LIGLLSLADSKSHIRPMYFVYMSQVWTNRFFLDNMNLPQIAANIAVESKD